MSRLERSLKMTFSRVKNSSKRWWKRLKIHNKLCYPGLNQMGLSNETGKTTRLKVNSSSKTTTSAIVSKQTVVALTLEVITHKATIITYETLIAARTAAAAITSWKSKGLLQLHLLIEKLTMKPISFLEITAAAVATTKLLHIIIAILT